MARQTTNDPLLFKKNIPDIVIITGSSGSGMSSATNAFQDLGYFCVDNPGVRGAWVIQVGTLYWCHVYSQEEDGQLRSTAGRAFGFDPQFGWVVNEGHYQRA
jgi:P-loop ATPase family protein